MLMKKHIRLATYRQPYYNTMLMNCLFENQMTSAQPLSAAGRPAIAMNALECTLFNLKNISGLCVSV